MSAFDRFTLAAAGTSVADVQAPYAPAWRRFQDSESGLSFEAPLEIAVEAVDGPFDLLVEGQMTMPFVYDVSFMTSGAMADASPKTLAHELATQWMVDLPLVEGPRVRRMEYPGVDEAWAITADVEDDAGTIGYSWVTLRKGGRIGCLSVSCWCAEALGRVALERTLASISGDSPA